MIRFGRAVIIAAAINAVLLLAASQLVRERPRKLDITVPTAVSLVNAPREETPPEEAERKPPEPPKPKPPMDFAAELPTPSLTAPALSGPSVALDVAMFGGSVPMSDMVFEATDLDQAPRAVVRTPPRYPYRARQRRIEGSVQVRFLVSADGTVSQVSVIEADPAGVFDEVVVEAVARWRFEPGRLAGKTVAAWVVAPLIFDLGGGG